jgi:hypothetical protein
MDEHKHQWIPYFYKVSYVGDGKNVNYLLSSVYCHECKTVEETK